MKVLVDSPDAFLRELASDELSAESVSVCVSLPEVTAGRDDAPDVMVLDDRGYDDEELAARLARWNTRLPGHPVILLTQGARLSEPPEGVTDVESKPLRAGALLGRVRLARRTLRRNKTRQEALLSMAVDAAGDVVEITTPEPILEYVNPAFTRTLGYTPEEAVGRSPGSLIRSEAHDPAYFQKIGQTLAAGEAWEGLLISQAKDGRLVHLETKIAPVFGDDGRMTHHVAVKRDITARMKADDELRRMNAELERARDAAIEASSVKSQFLANMSHELRTPLNAIIGYSEMLIEEAEDNDAVAFTEDLQKIMRAGSHLLSLINDILDLSKIEAGRMEVYLEDFELADAISAVSATVAPLFRERGNRLNVEVDPALGDIHCDLTKLRQTLLNLVSNANKFTDKGDVDIVARPERRHTVEGVRIDVRDQGIGMNPEQQAKLFQPFVQADASTTRRYGGTGLGLAICQRFCEMLGGTIDVESSVGAGSTFSVWLPVVVAEPTPEADPARGRHRVLVIDDDLAVRDLIARTLGRRGFDVRTAPNGPSGLEAAVSQAPDVIVLDVMMPGMDGWTVLSRLKDDTTTRDIPVVMLTMLDQQDVGYALGAVDYMLKPFQADTLARTLRRWCQAKAADILVIEDDAPTRELIRRTLEAAGHQVREAENGRVGLALAREHVPDLVLLDLLMPEVDGFVVLKTFRADPQLRAVPIVVATAKILTAEDHRRLESAQRVLKKGAYTRRELLAIIEDRVTEVLRRGRGSVLQAPGAGETGATHP